ncbi:hypothetical protein SLE2022_364560 [Rubroshorea leprosula]
MQCVYKPCIPSTPYPPQFGLPNSNPNLSIPKTQTQIPSKFLDNTIQDSDINDASSGSGLAKLPLPSHVKSITSTSNPFVKHCLKLRNSSSYRHAHGSALVVGSTPIREIFRIVRINTLIMKKLSGVQSTESIEAIALMRMPTTFLNLDVDQGELDCRSWFGSPHRVLVLDGIQDPGNLGTLLRSAVAFRWGGIYLLPGCCDPFNEKALRASRGASFQLPIVSGSWCRLQTLKMEFQMKMLAGHPDSNRLSKPVSSLSQEFVDSLSDIPLCLVLGSEGHGLSEKSQGECELVSIPMAGDYESLNVSVAGGIFLYMLQPIK